MTTDQENNIAEQGAAGPLSDQKGYSLVEMVVVMGIFVFVIILSTTAFDRLISTGSRESKSATSQIDGVVGLEMLRRDVTHAGYGLPWSFAQPPADEFDEVDGNPAADTGVDATAFNETVPHALAAATAGGTHPGTDYLVIKSQLLPHPSTNSTSGRWGYLNYSTTAAGASACTVRMAGDASSDLRAGDRSVIIATSVSANGMQDRELLNSGAGTNAESFSFALTGPQFMPPAGFQPVNPGRTYAVYGISGGNARMPYNRADYYVFRPPAGDPDFKIPSSCNTGTGILFKAVANHSGGYFTPYPLLNCVGDMKVVFILDPLGDGNLSHFPAASPAITGLTPQELRARLKSVTIYILTHEGKQDRNYTYPSNSIFVGPTIGSTQLESAGKLWSNEQLTTQFGPQWRNYRWKVYSMSVAPKNMQE